MTKRQKLRVSVIGLGRVGLSIAVTNATKGFTTICMDIDRNKIKKLKNGNPGFSEPKIKDLLEKSLKKIEFTTNLRKAILDTDITFLAVPTPNTPSGRINDSYIKKSANQIQKILEKKKRYHLLVVKSTVVPQTTEKIILPIFQNLIDKNQMDVVINPEFLREGNAISDILNPHIIIIGEYNKRGGKLLENYYRNFYSKLPEIIHTNLNTAEMIKSVNNLFLATKISFINSVANICQNIPGVDVDTIAMAIGKDSRIGPQFLKAGPGFGGSCLPKDLSTFIKFSDKYGKINNLFKAVQQVNDVQPLQIIKLCKKIGKFSRGMTIAVLGVSFKENTDDIRSAVSVKIVQLLLKNKLHVKIHDPLAIENFRQIFGNKISYFENVEKCLKNTDCCIILTAWNQYKKLTPKIFTENMNSPNIIDARKVLIPKKFSKLNFHAIGLGD